MSGGGNLDGLHDFDFLIGKWRVRHKTLRGRLTGSTDWDEAEAIDIVRPAFAGLGNVGRFMRYVDGKPYEGMPTRLYDPKLGKWRIYWLDTIDHRMEPPVIGGFKDGEGLFVGDDTLRGEPIKVRFIWSSISETTAHWEQAFSPDDGQTWEINSIMEFTRDDKLPESPTHADLQWRGSMIFDQIQKRRMVLAAILIILISSGLGLAKPGAKLLEAVAGISLPCQLLGCEAPASQTTSKEASLEIIQTADEALRDLADRHAQNILRDTPEWASQMGVTEAFAGEGFRSRLSQYDQASTLKAYAMQETMLKELQDFDREMLSDRSKITYDVMLNAYTIAGRQNAFEVGIPSVLSANAPYSVDQLFGPHIGLPRLLIAQSRIRTTEDADNWLSRLSAVDRVLMETADAVERDATRGVIPPYFALEAVAASARDFTSSEIIEHPIMTSLKTKLDATGRMTDAEKTAVYKRASHIVADQIYPAYRAFSERLEARIPAAGRDAGIWRLPDGEAMYRVALDAWGGNGMSPDEIHQTGLDDVARIHTEMDAILRDVGYVEGPIGQRMAALFKDPIYLVPNTDTAKAELVKELQRDANSVLDIAADWFLTIPDYPIEVRRIPPLEQDSASGGYYTPPPIDRSRPGIFWVNMKDSADIPVFTLKSLVFHEAVPGHHFQATMALSVKDLPLIQNMMWFGDYGEGWALYAEELAKEMGLYEGDPLGDLGRLRMELYRAARLVVDTGLHHKRWSREDAIDYMVEVTGESRESITREIERYAVWPGQAASYKLGMIQFQRLRARAEAELGEAFDIREFHDVVLRDGSMPMAVLTGRVDAWINSKKKA